jgi:hypothetical protein
MEQTPIQQAIAEFERLKAKAERLKDVLYLDGVITVLSTYLFAEREFAQKCFDAGQMRASGSTDNFETFFTKFEPK